MTVSSLQSPPTVRCAGAPAARSPVPPSIAPVRTRLDPEPCRHPAGRLPARADALDERRRWPFLQALYEPVARRVLDEENIIYLYHRRILVAHTGRLTGYKQVPDGILRVIGITLQ